MKISKRVAVGFSAFLLASAAVVGVNVADNGTGDFASANLYCC